MIEMLGVLAIIGVLSVGGIAGYSKAMTKFKINKMIEDYSNLTFNLIENYPNLLKSYSSVKTKNSELYNLAKDMGWIPDSWKPRAKSKTIYLDDGHNNLTHLFMRYNSDVDKRRVIMDIYIGSNIDNFDQLPQVSLENCMAIFSNWLVPMADVISNNSETTTPKETFSKEVLFSKNLRRRQMFLEDFLAEPIKLEPEYKSILKVLESARQTIITDGYRLKEEATKVYLEQLEAKYAKEDKAVSEKRSVEEKNAARKLKDFGIGR